MTQRFSSLPLCHKGNLVMLDVPSNATYPRIMTGKHPRAVGSYGPAAIEWALDRPSLHLRPLRDVRWWQRLVLDRALEHDKRGRLVWSTVLISAPRQVGKSYLERIGCGWRLTHSELFDEPQDVMHIAHKLSAAQEIWRPAARYFAGKYEDEASVRWANGEQKIELADGSRWMVQAANDGAGVSFTLSMVLVDEAWRVARHVVDGALAPTMVEAEQAQLWLVSTAGTSQSDLMQTYRSLGIATEQPSKDDSLLIVEWSAAPDPDIDIDDPAVWRAASPHWDDRRARATRKARNEAGELAFRQQWLNQWVPTIATPLFSPGQWDALRWGEPLPTGPLAFGVDVASDRSHAAIVALASGRVAEVIDARAGASWVAARVAELIDKWHPVGIGIDGTGPASTIADQLLGTDAGAKLVVLTGRQLATASGRLFDLICDGEIWAREHPELSRSVNDARKRPYGQSWAFARDLGASGSGVPILALTVALWAAEHAAPVVERSRIW